METKVCFDCGEEKPIKKFQLNRYGNRQHRCRKCPAPMKQRPNRTKEYKATKQQERRIINKLARYNLTVDKYEDILSEQGGRCAICGDPPGERRLAVDHDHGCCPGMKSCGGCIRGLLCIRCNIALGYFRDNPKNLEAAIAYLGE